MSRRKRWSALGAFVTNIVMLASVAILVVACQTITPYSITPPPSSMSPLPELPKPASPPTQTEMTIEQQLEKLPLGEVYHNVPDTMQVGVSETIEAGITPKVTQQIQKNVQGKSKVITRSGVRFNPAGDDFKVFKVKEGAQFVTAKLPGKWIWQVTPLKAGNQLIRVVATVDVKVPALNTTRSIEVEVFNDRRSVKVNWSYSIQEFIKTNWKEVITLSLGSGSLAGFIGWWLGQRKEQKKV
jgi:hypothetical protein